MTTQATIEQLDEQITRLTPQEQLKLVARVSERLSKRLPLLAESIKQTTDEQAKQERLKKVDAWLAACEEIDVGDGPFDSAADLRRIRDEDE